MRQAAVDQDEDGLETEEAPPSVVENLASIAEYDGNLADLVEEQELRLLGQEACQEYGLDDGSRAEWLAGYQRALKATKQDPAPKNHPFPNASNVSYPILTSACVQFNARAYSAIRQGGQPVSAKPQGCDYDGKKAAKAQRLASFHNHQLMLQCDEWDPGTDKLLMNLPLGGSGYRKVYRSSELARPVLEFATPDKVVLPSDAPSFDRSPRITQPVIYYPYEIMRLIDRGQWANHNWQTAGGNDTQKAVDYLEQQRYIDLDGDGLPEPYIVTLHRESQAVVRIDPGFQLEGLQVSGSGNVETILRESPLIHYYFLPSVDDSVYAMGFGQLLESLGGAVNTALNQMLDAAHRQNAGGGFIAQGLKMRGGEMKLKPREFKFINAPNGNIRDAVYEMKFDGPSMVLMNLVEFLLGGAQDITSVKEILTGKAPAGQAMGATLALIEQGLQVQSNIYTRIYASGRRELKLLMRLNKRHLDPRIYAEFLDDEKLLQELLEKTGSAPGAMSAMGAVQGYANGQAGGGNVVKMPGRPGAPGPAQWTPRALDLLMEDFDLGSMDVALGVDPRSMTDMQRMTRAELLRQDIGQPGVNSNAIRKRIWEAAHIENPDELLSEGPDPMQELALAKGKADVKLTIAQGVKTMQEAEQARQKGKTDAFERGLAQGQISGGVGGVEDPADGEELPPGAAGDDEPGGGGMDPAFGAPEPEA